MTTSNVSLPIESALPGITAALADAGVAVLRAPPGAGKTTRVPLALLDADWLGGRRIVLLEPRRLAARAAASRMAALLHEPVGHTVGYRMRLDTRVSAATRIEVVTEGVLSRMLQHDPGLAGTGLVIFDEFHERSVHADLGLALTTQARTYFRPDLRILVMSATLDTAAIAGSLGNAPIINSDGRQWPVETHWLKQPLQDFVDRVAARTTLAALSDQTGDILVFLPGAGEIRRVESQLRAMLDDRSDGRYEPVDVYPLYGQLGQDLQDRALLPSPPGRRKVVLATSIAETSLTIEGVRVVVDSGLMRVPRFSARTGMTRLETVRVTRDSADQRRGRAGRTAPGVCYRLWTEGEDAGLVPHRTPEILETDLAPLALELALWGVTDANELTWLDSPPAAGLTHARNVLSSLHAIDDAGLATPHGRIIAELGLHPRIAHMLLRALDMGLGDVTCDLAGLLGERDIFRGEHTRNIDLRSRLDALRTGRDARADAGALDRVRREASSLRTRLANATRNPAPPARNTAAEARTTTAARSPHAAPLGNTASEYAGVLIALAYPDRIAQRRPAATGRFILRNGRGAFADDTSPLSHGEFIAVAALDDAGREARILLAAPLERTDIETYFADDIVTTSTVEWDDATDSLRALRTRAFGSIILEQARIAVPPDVAYSMLLLEAVRRRGIDALPWSDDARLLRTRVMFARTHQPDGWPDLSADNLDATLEEWLLPFIADAKRMSDLRADVIGNALRSFLTWDQQRLLDSFAPTHITVPTGSRIEIDYADPAAPSIAVRLQEMFGLADTPRIAGGAVPVTLQLLSPARRPVQVTRDLAGFWSGSYFEVRKDLRGRYPKHYWPDDPLHAEPTRRAKGSRPDRPEKH